ncbi:longevity-assurance protein 1 [Patellaria atrata CBS 101060]|uniref:Longevity-assurance protein 1 n=1 Tax=Patellaria atrata CBS 101060 TaxID=1346257 RepID=A0A9P4S9Q1_9PEZI|nr:longevity-assurance protein 1 [Patellaria atrata CBS 101060]
MSESGIEPFPLITPAHTIIRTESKQNGSTRQRRKSSGLGGDPRGDTAVNALATLSDRTPPLTPTISRSPEKGTRRSKRRKVKTFFRRWKATSLRHTWLNPLLLCLLIVSLYLLNPSPSNPLHAALFLSYPLPKPENASLDTPTYYGKGGKDFAFVAFYTIFLSFTREFLMQRIIRPIAIRAGMKSRARQSRFMEQFYTALYFGIFGPFGVYVMSRSPVWYFNTVGMYDGFPHRTHEGIFKAYYLLQAAYWSQQAIVLILMLEKPRKDFKELVAHHIITIALIWCSYRFHFTYMGLAVYITHDISDFFLATSKLLNYVDAPIVGPYYFAFMLVWTYLRHYLNIRILISLFTEFSTIGPFELNWDTQQYKCWISQYITFALLASLQAVNLFWLFLIFRIAYRFVKSWGEVIEDERSEYEGSEDELEIDKEAIPNGVTKRDPVVVIETSKAKNKKAINGSASHPVPQVVINGEPVDVDSPAAHTRSKDKKKNR